jgi:hypothetical protein
MIRPVYEAEHALCLLAAQNAQANHDQEFLQEG